MMWEFRPRMTGAATGGGGLFQGDDDFFVFVAVFDFDQGSANIGVVGKLDDLVEVDAFVLQGLGRMFRVPPSS